MPYPHPGMPPSTMPSSSTATTTAQLQKGPVIGPQVPNTKPLFPAAQVSFFFLVQGLSAFIPLTVSTCTKLVVYSSFTCQVLGYYYL